MVSIRRPHNHAPVTDRATPGTRPQPPFRSPSGFAPANYLRVLVDSLADGDIVMAFDLADLDVIASLWGVLVASDHRVALARAVRSAIRVDDELAVTEADEVVALLTQPAVEAPLAVHRRVLAGWQDPSQHGQVWAAAATCHADEPRAGTLGRALGALRSSRSETGVFA